MSSKKSSTKTEVAVSYRPQPLIGQQAAQALLCQLMSSGKVPHALLLHGPKGIGKRLLAEHLAWTLLCGKLPLSAPDELVYDEASPAAPILEQGAHGGLHILVPDDGKKSISVEQVRKVLGKLNLADEDWRIVIIDAAEDMTSAGANSLLKTLEEPSGQTLLILISHTPSRLLPTIISRCRQVRCQPLEETAVRQILTTHEVDTAHLNLSINIAAGSPGRALRILAEGPHVLPELHDYFRALGRNQQSDITAQAERLLIKSTPADLVFEVLNWWLTQFSLAAAGAAHALPDEMIPLSQRLSALGWADLQQQALRLQLEAQNLNLTSQLVLESMLETLPRKLQSAAA